MNDLDCIVSLTTWKERIADRDTAKAIYSLIRQNTRYKYRVILTLSKEEFPNEVDDLPETIRLFYDNGLIDIIWAAGNYKALKKLYPVSYMYDVPILTTDDDIICSPDIVECFMNEHMKNKSVVISEQGIIKCGYRLTGGFRLFPQDSFIKVNPEYFARYFNSLEDDLFIAVLLRIKGTAVKYLHTHKMFEIRQKENDRTALRRQYTKTNCEKCKNDLIAALKRDGII